MQQPKASKASRPPNAPLAARASFRIAERLPRSRQLRILIGPSVCYFFPYVAGRRILLLGEKHSTKGIRVESPGREKLSGPPAIEVHEWLAELAAAAPKCFDIFLEVPYGFPRVGLRSPVARLARYISPSSAVEHTFLACRSEVASPKVAAPCPQQHFLNAPRIEDNWPMAELFFEQSEKIFSEAGLSIQPRHWRRRGRLYSFLMGRGDDDGAEFWSYLADLLRALGRESAFAREKARYEEFLPGYYRLLDEGFARAPELERQLFESVLMEVCLGYDILPVLWTLPMDYRGLQEFFASRPPAPESCCRGCSTRENLISLSGASHAERYADFMRRYFGVAPRVYSAEGALPPSTLEHQHITFERPFDFFGPA